jgi:hypothetical protein
MKRKPFPLLKGNPAFRENQIPIKVFSSSKLCPKNCGCLLLS